jgi:hypothetical protein
VRIGAEWDRAERLAAALAERGGTKVNVTAYVEAALQRENDRVERALKRPGD